MVMTRFVHKPGACTVFGLSTDSKPTPVQTVQFSFVEVDTGKIYYAITGAWVDVTSLLIASLVSGSLSGLVIPESHVTNLVSDLANIAGSVASLSSDPRMSNARTPVSHAVTHGNAGSDPVTVAESQVTGLVANLATINATLAAITSYVVNINLGSIPRSAGHVDVAISPAQQVGKDVRVAQMVGPYVGKGTLTDEAEMDGITACGQVTAANNVRVHWNASGPVCGSFRMSMVVG